jgi:hypothetical protein
MKTRSREAGFLMLGGASAMVLGVFLPWVKLTVPIIGTIGKAGIDGDGKIVLGLALAVGVCGYLLITNRANPIASVLGSLIALGAVVIMVFEAIDTESRLSSLSETLSGNPFAGALSYGLDFGFYLTCLGAAVGLIGSMVELRAALTSVEEPPIPVTPSPAGTVSPK